MSALGDSVTTLPGVGKVRADKLGKLGISTLEDVLNYFPRKYEDRTSLTLISAALPGQTVCIRAAVVTLPNAAHIRKGMDLVRFRAADDSAAVDITYFNQSYVKNSIFQGETYIFCGKIEHMGARYTMVNPVFEKVSSSGNKTLRIFPQYRLTAGITNNVIVSCVENAMERAGKDLPDYLPGHVREAEGLCTSEKAYRNIHSPESSEALGEAIRRLSYEEFFVLASALGKKGKDSRQQASFVLKDSSPAPFYEGLAFSPTGAQKRAIAQAAADMASGICMNRLVQGDVGCGKTLIASACIYLACREGVQAALMAPTEILAQQHFDNLAPLMARYGIETALLTGSMTAAEKRRVREGLQDGSIGLCIGTHALISKNVAFRFLALVITDEQHRFGVGQRTALYSKGNRPHTLVMSATPIPRTLALMIYGDLDVSIVDEMPPGRIPVRTYCVDSSYHRRLLAFIRKQAALGRQTFVVCPAVEEDEESELDLKSAEEYSRLLSEELAPLSVSCVHGRMKQQQKDEIMAAFAGGKTDVLVSTTVIEVGVDVPNASLMIIENAERFGLSQLHQLRGRVGRGGYESYCVLVTDNKSDETKERMDAMCASCDGFEISRKDLEMRGPGDFFGDRQHGLPEMHLAGLCSDLSLMQRAQQAAESVLKRDPELKLEENAALRRRVFSVLEKCSGTLS